MVKLSYSGIVVPFCLSFLVCFMMTPLVRNIAARWKICDKPNDRANGDIAHIGGVAIVAAIVVGLVPVFLFLVEEQMLPRVFFPVLIVSGFIIFVLGVIDDLRSLHYKYKLVLQLVASVIVSLGGIFLFASFFSFPLTIHFVVAVFIAITLWIMAVTSSFNLIDGIDGLATGIAVIAAAELSVAGYLFDNAVVLYTSVVVLGASVAFLRYNFPPAMIFMGDSGSLFFGLILGLITIFTVIPGKDIFYRIAGCVFILSIPLTDAVLAFLRRAIEGRPVFEADLKHLHYVLLFKYGSMRKVDFALWGLSLILGILGVWTMTGSLAAFIIAASLQLALLFYSFYLMTNTPVTAERINSIIAEYRKRQ
ncbi:MAG: MraY family glycosyltransferase [Candidatus Krumholzibacteriales bacterium]